MASPTLHRGVNHESVFPANHRCTVGKGETRTETHRNSASLKTWDGLAQDSDKTRRALYGNGVTIVPNVHAVMAWAASVVTLTTKRGLSRQKCHETLARWGKGDSPTTGEHDEGDNECYRNAP